MNTRPFTTRQAELKDADPLARLINSAYRGERAKKGWTTEAYLIEGQRTDAEAIRRRGYRDCGRREPFPYGNPREGHPVVTDLEFIVLEKPL